MVGTIDFTDAYCPHCGRGNPAVQNPFTGPNTTPPEFPNTPWAYPGLPCSLNQPMGLYIPPGQAMTIPCPVHGTHVLVGNGPTCGGISY